MLIDLIMISKLGTSDGGREIWLKNFLQEIGGSVPDKNNLFFNLITLNKAEKNILNKEYDFLIKNHIQYKPIFKKIPISIKFIIFCLIKFFFKKKEAEHVLAVGGLEEALATVMGYSFRRVRGKRILWLRTIYTKEKGYLLNRFTQKFLLMFEIFIIKNFFDLIVANGDDTADFYRAYGVECHVIKNSIDLKKWSNPDSNFSENKLDIAFIGRLAEVKGIKSFLDAIIVLKESMPTENIKFHVIGDGPFSVEVEKLANKNLLTYYGAIPNQDLPKIMKKFDCCVGLTYLSEFMGGGGVSNALIEQMASGKIMVCWANNIFYNVLNQDSCYFVNQGNIEELADTFLEISNNKEISAKKVLNSYLISQNYSIEIHVKIFFSLLEMKK